MSENRTPPQSPRRVGSVPLHVPTTPSRLRESIARSPDERRTVSNDELDERYNSGLGLLAPIFNSGTSDAITAEPEPLKEDGDDQARGRIIEPTSHDEDERTALLENYHHHRVCGLRNCNHGTFSPRAPSITSTINDSILETPSGMRYPQFMGEHEQPRDFAHAVFGDPIGDALMGTRTSNTTKHLTRKHGLRNTNFMYIAYYLPCIKWISQYQWSWLRGDLAAAFTMASFYIPMSLSYASNLGHIPPLNGLYSFVIHPLVYALLGSCPQMAVGPEAPGSLLVGAVVAASIKNGNANDGDDAMHAEIAGVVTATAGAIIFAAGLTRLGFLDSVLSRPFLRGFISAIGVVIFIDQAIPELGLSEHLKEVGAEHGSTVNKLVFLIQHIKYSHGLTAAVSWGSFAIIMFLRTLKNYLQPRYPTVAYFPDRFIVVVVSTILAWRLNWEEKGLALLGHVAPPGHVFNFHWPFRFQHMQHIDTALSTSLIIALLGFFESSVAAKSLGEGTSELKGIDVSPNRELIALGSANLLGGCFMSLPAFGGYGRSKVNVSTGGTTPMSGALLSLLSLLCVFYVLPYFYYIPKGVLSAMISVVAYSLVEEAPHDIRFFIKVRGWTELALMACIFLSTIFYSITVGIALGMGLSLLQIVRHATKPRIQILGRLAKSPNRFENAENFAEDDVDFIEGCLIVKIPEPLTFANTGALKTRLRRFERYGTSRAHPSLPRIRTEEHNKNIIFDVHGVTSIDGSGTQVLTEIVEGYVRRGARVVFCRLPHKRSMVYESFRRSGIVELCGGRQHFVGSIDEALKLAEAEDMESYFSRSHTA